MAGSEVSRPFSCTTINAENSDFSRNNAIGQHKRSPAHHALTGSGHSAWPPTPGKTGKESGFLIDACFD